MKSSDATDDDDVGTGLAIRYATVLVELFLRVILFVGVLELRYVSTYTSNSIERADGENANKLSATAAGSSRGAQGCAVKVYAPATNVKVGGELTCAA